MEESKDVYKREYRNVTIRTIDGSTLLGKVNIGIKERVSELFTKTENLRKGKYRYQRESF